MKILLIGEYSGFHNALKNGLKQWGHDVTIASIGDGVKRIPTDIDLTGGKVSFRKYLSYLNYVFFNPIDFKKYDLIQLMNPVTITHKGPIDLNYFFLKGLFSQNKNIFMVAAGDDAYYWKFGRSKLRYGPFDGQLVYDEKSKKSIWESNRLINLNEFVLENIRGVIPAAYDYFVGYEGHPKLLDYIPMPIDIGSINFSPLRKDKKNLTFFHGLNRPGFKGTRFVEAAFELLRKKYSGSADFLVKGKMPLKDYLNLLSTVDVVVDQTSSYSMGMNALFSMAMGKIVMSGAEPEALSMYPVNKSPCINILPDANDICEKVENILSERVNYEAISHESRRFVEDWHCSKSVAKKYLEAWS